MLNKLGFDYGTLLTVGNRFKAGIGLKVINGVQKTTIDINGVEEHVFYEGSIPNFNSNTLNIWRLNAYPGWTFPSTIYDIKMYDVEPDGSKTLERHLIPVPFGDTQYSDTPAPSNCFWESVTETYIQANYNLLGIKEVA